MKECYAQGLAPEGAMNYPGAPLSRCEGVHDWHHVLKRQVLTRELKGTGRMVEALADRRNLVRVCRKHHEWLTGCRIHLSREDLPASVEEFAAEHNLEWALDRYYGELRQAA